MAKKIVGFIKLQVPAGKANPSPPIGPALGQRGLNIMEFCKAFNAQTQAPFLLGYDTSWQLLTYLERNSTSPRSHSKIRQPEAAEEEGTSQKLCAMALGLCCSRQPLRFPKLGSLRRLGQTTLT